MPELACSQQPPLARRFSGQLKVERRNQTKTDGVVADTDCRALTKILETPIALTVTIFLELTKEPRGLPDEAPRSPSKL